MVPVGRLRVTMFTSDDELSGSSNKPNKAPAISAVESQNTSELIQRDKYQTPGGARTILHFESMKAKKVQSEPSTLSKRLVKANFLLR